MKNHKFLATVIVLTLVMAGISAADTWTTYNTSNTPGLGNNTIKGAAVETGGIKWFGTNGGGVSKFTGTSWQKYTTS